MPTAPTLVTFKRAVVAALQARAALSAVKVAYAWPGPSSTPEMIAFDVDTDGSSTIAGMKAGRKQRQETYRPVLVVWAVKNASTAAAGSDEAEARAFELAAEVDAALADDPKISADVQWSVVGDWSSHLEPNEKGWGCQLSLALEVNARLT